MAFIQPEDYSVLITDDQLAQITQNQQDIDICLLQSEEEVKEYLRHRFDVETDMRSVKRVVEQVASAEAGQRIYNTATQKYYTCIRTAINQPLTNILYFTYGDDRNQKLIQVTIDVFLYHLHSRLNPRNIPDHRRMRYDGDGDVNKAMSATKWLLMVQKGTITPNLTPILDSDGEQIMSGHSIQYGSSPNPMQRNANNSRFYTGG